jgi:hypothetical protein
MALSRSKQNLQEKRTKLGIEYVKSVQLLIDLAKGRIHFNDPRALVFYRVLTYFNSFPFRATSLKEAQEILANAWWVEEDDIRQEIYFATIRYYKRGAGPNSLFVRSLGYFLLEWLIFNQKVLYQKAQWKEKYFNDFLDSVELEDLSCYQPPSLFNKIFLENNFPDNELNNLTPFEKYLLYLHYGLDLPYSKIAPILLTSRRQAIHYYGRLKIKLENKYARTIKPKRPSK